MTSGRRRWPVALLAGLALAAACSSDPTESANGAAESPSSSVAAETSVAPDDPAAEPSASTSPGAPVPDETTPPTSGAVTSAPPTTSQTPAVPAVGAVGSFGPWYLRSDAAASIVLEVRSQAGAEPSAGTVDAVRAVLAEASGKPVTTAGGSVPGGGQAWTPDAIRAEADRTGPPQRADAAVLTLLFVGGELADGDQALGVAVRSDVAAIFSDKIDEASGPLTSRARVEEAVSVHEVGHLLGLVDLVLETGRQDPEHPGHSRNRGSVMYFAVESTLVGDLLGGGPPTRFDDADRADLRAIAGR